jgi:CelD/BcsL family acetyltransferase involved in cellulose biosynthesis
MATVHAIDPLEDSRWDGLVARHPKSSIFHTAGWLRALKDTYGFQPLACTTSPPGAPLDNALLLCGVRSWLTGSRLVSLPFSDHCEPLTDDPGTLAALCDAVQARRTRERWRSVELRFLDAVPPVAAGFARARRFHLHRLDLRPGLDAVLRATHKDCIRRKIRRAERERLTHAHGRTEALLGALYGLLALTRERQGVPIQPLAWFRNLVAGLGDRLTIHIAAHGTRPVAGVLVLHHGATEVYKYGGSDAATNNLGGMPFLLWKVVEDASRRGAQVLDLGRSDWEATGLVEFKDRWGAARTTLTYWQAPGGAGVVASPAGRVAARAFARLPSRLRAAASRFVYRHVG